jgi:hypothetical protein
VAKVTSGTNYRGESGQDSVGDTTIMERTTVDSAETALGELPSQRSKPKWLERQVGMPFDELGDDDFEVFCFLLLRNERPNDRIFYYGKTKDGGRDIIHIKDGKTILIQCKRYTAKVGIREISGELAKLCTNVFHAWIPDKPDEVQFYVVPDVSGDAADLIRAQTVWREKAPEALEKHLKEAPSKELLVFANAWWPSPTYVTAVSLTERVKKFPDLREEFFAVRKVIDASLADVRGLVAEQTQELKQLFSGSQTSHTGEMVVIAAPSIARPTSVADIASAFTQASQPLLGWPTTLQENRWLSRPELADLSGRISAHGFSTTLLLGAPGSGKSALLARLGNSFAQIGGAVIGIKADVLPPEIDSLAALSEFLHLPALLPECVRQVSEAQRTLLLVDQLDALADLVDLRSERLNVLLNLVRQLDGTHNVHIVCSCRTFEHGHDVRLTAIEATALHLALPTWEQVAEILREREIEAAHWPVTFRELLRVPQHLKVFLQRLQGSDEDRIFSTYQQLLDDLWTRRVINTGGLPGRSKLLMDMAEVMAEQETIWLPMVRFEDSAAQVADLEAKGILTHSANGLSIGFQHQTLFEHARARAFARGHGSLSRHVLERQESLFVRPLLWSTLHYLRGADPASYDAEMALLWSASVRKHVRHLLIDFLGQISSPPPSAREQVWLLEYLHNPVYRAKVLASVRGNDAWFDILSSSHIPTLMRLPEPDAWPVVGVLGSAWSAHRARCLALLTREWLPDPAKDRLTWQTLTQMAVWDGEAVEMACQIVVRAKIAPPAVMSLASQIATNAPALAVRLAATKLHDEVCRLEREADPPAPPPPVDESDIEGRVKQATFRPRERFDRLLEESQGWYELPSLAEAVPQVYIDAIWPWFCRVLDALGQGPEPMVMGYRNVWSLATRMCNEEADEHRYPLIAAMHLAIRTLAEQDPTAFLAFLEREKSRDSMIVQRLLCLGLHQIAATQTEAGVRFLTDDHRRFLLGPFEDEYSDTLSLIAALVPHLSDGQIAHLEAAILAWRRYSTVDGLDAETRFETAKWERQHRVRLLAALPLNRLSTATRTLVRDETAAFPHYENSGVHRTYASTAESPMSAQQMGRARNPDILHLFTVLHDRQEHHPRDFLVGGSTEAARQFGDFAKEHPQRALEIIRQFLPGRQERPAVYAIEALAGTDYPTDALLALVVDLDGRGFHSEEFRVLAARALSGRARSGEGLPDAICALFEQWLGELSLLAEPVEREHQPRAEDEGRPRSVLWEREGLVSEPWGSYTLLQALTRAYLLREPPETARWLAVLEAQVERPASPGLWKVFARNLQDLHLCNHAAAERFLRRLFDRFPDVRDSVYGSKLLTRAWWYLPPSRTHEFLAALRASPWKHGQQAFGELVTLRTLVFPRDEEARRQVEQILDTQVAPEQSLTQLRIGIGFCASRLWPEQKFRARATDFLLRLIPLANPSIAHAVMEAFQRSDVLYPDAETFRFLRALTLHPDVLRAGEDTFLVERLEDVLSADPDLVYTVCRHLVILRAEELVSYRTGFAANTSHLTNMALTLQRLGGDYRRKGLELFEQLLDAGVHDAQATLNELDRRPLHVAPPIQRRPRRRSRR